MELDAIANALTQRSPLIEESTGALQAGVSLLLAPGPEILLIRRAEHPKDPWSGQIGLPGGTKEKTDTDLLATAIRETEEEVGISLSESALLGRLDDFRPRRQSLPDVLIRPYVFSLDSKPETTCSDEIQYCLWNPIKDLAASHCQRDITLPKGEHAVDAYLAGEKEIVWGITYRILSGFFRTLELT